MKNAVYRSTLSKRERDYFKDMGRYCDEQEAPEHLKKELEKLPFKLGDKVVFTHTGFFSDEDPTEVHTIDVIDTADTHTGYMVDIDKGGEDVYGWVMDIDIEKPE